MFEARMPAAVLFKKIIESMREVVDEANFQVTKNGIQLQAMDASHVSLCSLLLRKDGFENYRCDRTLTLGFNISSVSKIMKCAANDDSLLMRASDDSDTITFIFESSKDGKVSEYKIKLMDIDAANLSVGSHAHTAIVQMPSMEFQRAIRDLSMFSETAGIEVTKEGVKFSASGDMGSGVINLKQMSAVDDEEKEMITVDINEPIAQCFASRLLGQFTKAAPLAERVSLSMSQTDPLMVEFSIKDMGYLRFYLAPQIEEDEDDEDGEEN